MSMGSSLEAVFSKGWAPERSIQTKAGAFLELPRQSHTKGTSAFCVSTGPRHQLKNDFFVQLGWVTWYRHNAMGLLDGAKWTGSDNSTGQARNQFIWEKALVQIFDALVPFGQGQVDINTFRYLMKGRHLVFGVYMYFSFCR
jgi:hypothetical protein